MLSTSLPGMTFVLATGVAAVVAMIVTAIYSRGPLRLLASRPWWIISVTLASIAAGALALELYRPGTIDLRQVNGKPVCGLIEELETYDYGMRIKARLAGQDAHQVTPQRVLLSTSGCNYLLHEGDLISFECKLLPVTNLGNPDEFDRESHLWQQGILYSQHLPVAQIACIGHRPTLLAQAASLRRQLVQKVLATSLSPDAQDLMIALLLGHSRQIDSSVRNRFSQAGIAHILALSGLHVGLITGLIWFLLFPLDYFRLKKLRLLLTLLSLLGFALLTGMSPSVVRATIMIGFTLLGIVLYRRSTALNAMCVSALLTLCVWPTAIYQAGFQLSYITVGAIVGFQGRLLPDANRKRRFWHWLWSLLSTSLIAMLATIMLTAYYFCSISPLSILSNVLILPVMPILMVLGAIFLLLAAIGLDWSMLNGCIELIYGYMNRVSAMVSSLPGAHYGGLYVTGLLAVLFYLGMACLIIWLMSRNIRWLLAALAVAVMSIAHLAWVGWRTPVNNLLVLNDYSSTPILWQDDGMTFAWLPDNRTADRGLFEQTHRRLLAHWGNDSVQWVDAKASGTSTFVRSPWAFVNHQHILVLGKGISRAWLEEINKTTSVDLLIVTKRYHGSLPDVVRACHPRLVLLSGDLPDDRHAAHLDSCRQLGQPVHDIRSAGAYVTP